MTVRRAGRYEEVMTSSWDKYAYAKLYVRASDKSQVVSIIDGALSDDGEPLVAFDV
jgi:hypothetical protein